MSQKVKIMGAKVTGMVYLGPVFDPETSMSTDRWSGSPDEVMTWLWNVYRARFNQRRSLRSKHVYIPDPGGALIEKGRRKGKPVMVKQLDEAGVPLLTHIGKTEGVDELKSAFRVSHPFAAAAPDLMLECAGRSENIEWFAAAKRRKKRGGAMPFFRSRKRESVRFTIFTGGPARGSQQAAYVRTGRKAGVVTITGMNPVGKAADGHSRKWSVKIRVRSTQQVLPYTSVSVDWTAKSLVFVSAPAEIKRESTGVVAGIDLGVTHTIVSSDGTFFDQPKVTEQEREIARRQKVLARKIKLAGYAGKKGYQPSERYAHERRMLAAAHQRKNDRLNDWRHKTTTELVRQYDLIGYESLNVKGMTTSAKGTAEQPGKNVRQKAGLNRSLARSSFGMLRSMLEYKATASGVLAIPVDPKNTSRKCSRCHHTARENRESQAVFRCVECGHTANADLNAAENILQRAMNQLLVAVTQDGPGHAPAGDTISGETDPTLVVQPLGVGGTASLKTTRSAAPKLHAGIPAL